MGLRNGISPLAGAVLFVAVVMTAAAMLTGWVFAMDLGGSGERVVRQPQCQYGGVDIFDARYRPGSGELTVTVVNVGTIRLRNVSVTVLRQGEQQARSSVIGLNRGALKTATLTTPTRPGQVTVASVDCPNVTARTTDITTAG